MYNIRITSNGMSYLLAGEYSYADGQKLIKQMSKDFGPCVFIQLFAIGAELPAY